MTKIAVNKNGKVNRGWLKRMAQKGKLVCTSSYHYDDMTGSSQLKSELPVVMLEGNRREYREDRLTLTDWDFETSCGCAYLDKADRIVLIVHSNCNYTFKVLEYPIPSSFRIEK